MTDHEPSRAGDDWRAHLLASPTDVRDLLHRTRRVAVLGIKTEAQAGEPAFFVPEYVQQAGLEVVPVPVYFPEVRVILGQPVYRTLAEIPGEIDMVNVFRRSHRVAAHLDDILAKRPKSVWMQVGIRDDEVAEQLAREGIDVVQDRCLMVELRRWGRK